MLSLCELCFPSASLVDTAMPKAYLSVHMFFPCQGGGDVGGRITDKWERVGEAVLILGISLESNTPFFLNGALHHHEIMLLISSFFSFFLSLLTSLLYILSFNLFPFFFHKLKYCLINSTHWTVQKPTYCTIIQSKGGTIWQFWAQEPCVLSYAPFSKVIFSLKFREFWQ